MTNAIERIVVGMIGDDEVIIELSPSGYASLETKLQAKLLRECRRADWQRCDELLANWKRANKKRIEALRQAAGPSAGDKLLMGIFGEKKE